MVLAIGGPVCLRGGHLTFGVTSPQDWRNGIGGPT